MIEYNTNSYYAFIWGPYLSSNRERIVKGNLIHRNIETNSILKMFYGTNSNDIYKVNKLKFWKEIEYKIDGEVQSVKYWKPEGEKVIERDMRIIVWEGSESTNLSYNKYRIVSPQIFELLVKGAKVHQVDLDSENYIEKTFSKHKKKERKKKVGKRESRKGRENKYYGIKNIAYKNKVYGV